MNLGNSPGPQDIVTSELSLPLLIIMLFRYNECIAYSKESVKCHPVFACILHEISTRLNLVSVCQWVSCFSNGFFKFETIVCPKKNQSRI